MRSASFLFLTWLTAASGLAAGPEYEADPFNDADFPDAPLILDVAYPMPGRAEVAVLFTSSLTDKYTTHQGGLLQVEYGFTETLGIAVTTGYLHGRLTSIVTSDSGIIGARVEACTAPPTACGDVTPDLPDDLQITGLANAALVWKPLYGKINVVSEIDVNMQLFLMAGAGVNGTREVTAQTVGVPAFPSDYELEGDGLGDGGFMSDPKVHGTLGIGAQVFLSDWLALRADVRGIVFQDDFDFDADGTVESDEDYYSQNWFLQVGLGFPLF